MQKEKGLHSSSNEETDPYCSAFASISIRNRPLSVEVYHPSDYSVSQSAIRRERIISFLCCQIISFSWKTPLKVHDPAVLFHTMLMGGRHF